MAAGAGEAVGLAGPAPGRAGSRHLLGTRSAAGRPSVSGRPAAPRARGRRPVGRGRRGAGDRQRPRRDDDPELGPAGPAEAGGDQCRLPRCHEELRRGDRHRGGRQDGGGRAGRRAGAAGGLDQLPARLANLRESARERLAEEFADELGFLDAFAAAVPDDATVVCDMCIPGYWLGGFHPVPAPRRLAYPMGWGTLGLGVSGGDRVGAGRPGAGRRRLRGRRLPLRLRRAGHGGAGALPLTALVVDDGGYGMLRYDYERRGRAPVGVDLQTPDFVALAALFGVGADAVDGLGDALRRRSRAASPPEPSILVARAAFSRRPRRRRAGIGGVRPLSSRDAKAGLTTSATRVAGADAPRTSPRRVLGDDWLALVATTAFGARRLLGAAIGRKASGSPPGPATSGRTSTQLPRPRVLVPQRCAVRGRPTETGRTARRRRHRIRPDWEFGVRTAIELPKRRAVDRGQGGAGRKGFQGRPRPQGAGLADGRLAVVPEHVVPGLAP